MIKVKPFYMKIRYFIDFNQNLEKNFSSGSCLMYLSNKIATGFESGLYTSMIHTDLQKTLGAFNYEILINKTECLGFSKDTFFSLSHIYQTENLK